MPTKIQWCDETYNPWWGCERVSPACAHCYADTFARRIGMDDLWSKSGEHGFRFFGDKHWQEPFRWARTLPGKLGRRPRVFCASMADVFEDHPLLEEHRLRLFDLIVATPELDWLLLTKRPEFARDWLANLYAVGDLLAGHLPETNPIRQRPLPNVWVGVSIENARYTWRANVLREIPAAVRFISAEPLLGSLFDDTRGRIVRKHGADHDGRGGIRRAAGIERARSALDLSGIDWVIIGGESGPGARPFRLEHAREIIHACRDRDVACCQNPRAECCGRQLESGECCNQPVPGSCCGQPERFGPGPAVFVKQLGARPIESGETYAAQVAIPIECEHGYDVCPECDGADAPLSLRDRMGGDWDEWPPDLRIREFPTVLVTA